MHYLFIFASEEYNQSMVTATFTESEINYVLDILFYYALFDEKVATVCRILSTRFPERVIEGKVVRVGEGSDETGI